MRGSSSAGSAQDVEISRAYPHLGLKLSAKDARQPSLAFAAVAPEGLWGG